ncbi:MAG: GlsB/YeaQ/YmgE family stress response membrane protein [Armatimonadetes bacterium]|nr:GlsB/YeaQ/YmgE family stress response membrane protein [Armatimonadota bacterium]
MSFPGWILLFIIGTVCASIVSVFVPNRIRQGFFVAVLIGVAGGWLGDNLLGSIGPSAAGVAWLPAVAGSAALVLAVSLLSEQDAESQT